MKKTAITTAALLFSMSALTAPAMADNNAVRLGVGIGLAVVGEIIKQSKGKTRPVTRNTRKKQGGSSNARRGKAATVAALALPAVGPVVEWRPDPMAVASIEKEQAADLDLRPSLSDEPQQVQLKEDMLEVVDEYGHVWGKVTMTQFDQIREAVEMGMQPSLAIPILSGLSEPSSPVPVFPDVAAVEPTPEVREEPQAEVIEPVAPVAVAEPSPVVEPAPPVVAEVQEVEPAAPVEPAEAPKPKLDIDL